MNEARIICAVLFTYKIEHWNCTKIVFHVAVDDTANGIQIKVLLTSGLHESLIFLAIQLDVMEGRKGQGQQIRKATAAGMNMYDCSCVRLIKNYLEKGCPIKCIDKCNVHKVIKLLVLVGFPRHLLWLLSVLFLSLFTLCFNRDHTAYVLIGLLGD